MDRAETLHAAIDEHPDQAATYLVLADHLQECGDPRGEVIALWARRDRAAERERVARAQALGPPAFRHGAVDWFYGYVRSVRAIVDAEDDRDALAAYLDHEAVRHVTAVDLQLAGDAYAERQWVIDVIAARPRPAWRQLAINSYRRGGNDPPCGDLDLAALWDAAPRLATLAVHARHVTPGAPRSPTLTSLAIDARVEHAELAPLLAGSMPALRELVLHDTDAAFARLAERSPLAAQLARLAVTTADPERYEQVGE